MKTWLAVASSKSPPSSVMPCASQLSLQFRVASNFWTCSCVWAPIQARMPGRSSSVFTISTTLWASSIESWFAIRRLRMPHNWSIRSCVCDLCKKHIPARRSFLLAIRLLMYLITHWFFDSRTVLSPRRRKLDGNRLPRWRQISATLSNPCATNSAIVELPCLQVSSITWISKEYPELEGISKIL